MCRENTIHSRIVPLVLFGSAPRDSEDAAGTRQAVFHAGLFQVQELIARFDPYGVRVVVDVLSAGRIWIRAST